LKARHITLLVEEFRQLASAGANVGRYPSLERIFSRGNLCGKEAVSPNHLRFDLFGIEPDGLLPVAALTHVSDRERNPGNDYYWLRTDPVTMWADMARVFMTSHGFADLDPYERNEIENCIRSVLLEEGFDMQSDHAERWCIPLNAQPGFDFTPLNEALGMDVADALPDHPEALFWKRILNEIQIALHHCPVNVRRRRSGRQEINSVWFWGGGFIPDAAPHDLFDTVYSDHPVSRGLAIINDCRLKQQAEASAANFRKDGLAVLVDWTCPSNDPGHELEELDKMAGLLLERVNGSEFEFTIYEGSGAGRHYDRRAGRRFWKRNTPLAPGRTSPARA